MGITPQQAGFASAVLRGIGARPTPQNIAGFVGWSKAEGGDNWSRSNPLNTTQAAPGARTINSAGVKGYANAQQGIQATIQTLRNGRYGGIINAFRSGNVRGLAGAIGSSPWGTSGSLAAQTIAQTLGQPVPRASGVGGGGMAGPSATGPQSVSTTVPTFNQAGYQNAQQRYEAGRAIMAASKMPPLPNVSSGFAKSLGNPNSVLFSKGLLSTSPPYLQNYQGTKTIQTATQNLQKLAGTGLVNVHAGAGGDVNPIPGAVIGRTDMGVDANLKPGSPILAPNDAKVVGTMPNWYAGQPYVAVQLLAGPNRGKVMYVAEQISGVPKQGTIIRRGQPITRYASSGTGIEIGWANPRNPLQTMAQATGQTGDASHGNAPAGVNFRSYLKLVGGR